MKTILNLILLFGFLIGCNSKRELLSHNNFKKKTTLLDDEYNCGGFLFNKISKNPIDSAIVEIKIISCIDSMPIPFSWVKLKERSATKEIKLTADKEGKIYQTLPSGYYRLESTSIHYNIVSTPLLLLSNYNYKIYFHLGAGDPLID